MTQYRLRCEKCGRISMEKWRLKVCRANHWDDAAGTHGQRIWCRGKLKTLSVIGAPPKKVKARPKRKAPALTAKIEQAQAMLNKSISKVKLATTLVDRWQKRLRALNRKLADELANGPTVTKTATRMITLED